MSFPRYPAYKPTGVEWLGEVPEHWDILPLKRRSRLLTEKTECRDNPVALENIEGWTGRFIETDTEFQGEGIAFESGDILFGKLRPYLAKAYLAAISGQAVGDFHVIHPLGGLNSRFLQLALLTRELIDLVNGSTFGAKMPRASWDFLGSLPLCMPPLDEQHAIASFLDRETAKIDALIAEQQCLIELLQEKSQAVISHAVTKGLNPNAPMKDSVVEWLGEVPEHWQVLPVRRCLEVRNNLRTPIDVATRLEMEGDYPYYGPTGILSYIDRYMVEGEHFLIGEDGDHFLKFERLSMSLITDGQFNVNNHAHLLRGGPSCLTKWGALIFEHRDLAPWLIKQGVGRYKLRKERLMEIPMAIPPLEEQKQIIEFVDAQRGRVIRVCEECTEMIAVLQERRSALISAAVTGQIDVRGQVPEEAE